MLKDIRLHGEITPEVDFFAVLAGEKLAVTHFYEIGEGAAGREASFFLAGSYFKLDQKGIAFSGTGGAVSEYMFGSPMPLNDLGHKEISNRLVVFGTYAGTAGQGRLEFTPNVSGVVSYRDLFLEGNALGNLFFLIKTPWPYSVRRTQEVLLKTLGRRLKRSPHPGAGNDSELAAEILKELSEPDATLLLLRLAHRPHRQFYDFVRGYYLKEGEWGEPQERFVTVLADELGIEQYQRKRIAIDILYKAERNRPILDEYKDILVSALEAPLSEAALGRINTLRGMAVRHGLPPTLFDTLDGLLPTAAAARGQAEAPYLRRVREILLGLFEATEAEEKRLQPNEVAELLSAKQRAHHGHDNGFEQVLLDTGRRLDEYTAETEDYQPFETFSELLTYLDRLDNAEAVVSHLVYMEHASISEEKVRSLLGNREAFETLEAGLFQRLVVDEALKNPYALGYGKRKLSVLLAGLQRVERGEQTCAEVAARVERLAKEEQLHERLYGGIRRRLKQFYFNLSNPAHVRLLQADLEAETLKQGHWAEGSLPPGAFDTALEQVQRETEYLNNIYPRILAGADQGIRDQFLSESHLDLYKVEELEREYRQAHGLEAQGPQSDVFTFED